MPQAEEIICRVREMTPKDTFNEGLIKRIHKELKKVNSKRKIKQLKPNLKWAVNLNNITKI